VNPDLSAYDQIIPCGILDASVTSLSKELQKDILVEQVQPIVEKHILLALEKVS
jgi:lipoyl(octanoyl) transferase